VRKKGNNGISTAYKGSAPAQIDTEGQSRKVKSDPGSGGEGPDASERVSKGGPRPSVASSVDDTPCTITS